jgi:hypothetical protein
LCGGYDEFQGANLVAALSRAARVISFHKYRRAAELRAQARQPLDGVGKCPNFNRFRRSMMAFKASGFVFARI